VFAKDTIDPTLDINNKLYGSDAWTPTQTRLKKNPVFNNKEVSNILKSIKRTIGVGFNQIFDMSQSEFRNSISNADGSIYDALSQDIGMQTAYAKKYGLISQVPKSRDGKIDLTLLKEQLDAKLDNDVVWRNYKKWLGQISDTVITSYDNATNEDIMNNMKAQPDSAKKFKLTEYGELTVPAKEYFTIDEYRNNKGRLSKNADNEAKIVGKSFVDWASNISNNSDTSVRNVVDAINSAFNNRYDADDIVNHFAEKSISISRVEATFMLKNEYLLPSDIVGKARYIDANGDISVGTVINIRKITFGGLELENVRASVVESDSAPLLLGQSVLNRLGKIEIDYERSVLKITTKERVQ
jgi:hypothetical protein